MGMGGAGGGGNPMGFDASAAFKNERESLGITRHEWLADKAEKDLLGDLYPDPHSTGPVDLSRGWCRSRPVATRRDVDVVARRPIVNSTGIDG
eukprot:gene37532-46304_t